MPRRDAGHVAPLHTKPQEEPLPSFGTPSGHNALCSKINPKSGPLADTCPRHEKRGLLAAGGATRLATHSLLSHLLRNACLLLESGSEPLPLPRRETLFQFHDFSGFGSGSSEQPKRTPCGEISRIFVNHSHHPARSRRGFRRPSPRTARFR